MNKKTINKNTLFIIIIVIILSQSILNPKLAINSVMEGLNLWFYNVMPSLLPFMIFSNILFKMNIAYYLKKLFNRIMNKIMNVSGSGILPLFMGYISGYPLGSKLVCDLRKEKYISLKESYKLLALCCTTGPAFIISIVSLQMFNNMAVAPILIISNYLGAILNALILKKFYKEKISSTYSIYQDDLSITKILNDAITNSIDSIIKIGGYIIFFKIIINYLDNMYIIDNISGVLFNYFNVFDASYDCIKGAFYGIFEITIGINAISQCNDPLIVKLAITSFLIAWSGFSIHMQTNSFILDTDICFYKYMIGKISQSFLSLFICVIAYKIIYPTTVSVYMAINNLKTWKIYDYVSIYYCSLIFLIISTILLWIINKKIKN